MYEYCRVERDGHVLTVTLNRPAQLNAIHPPASVELARVWDDFASDPDLWVGILTGEGRGFSAGNDLKYTASGGDMSISAAGGFGGITNRFDLDKPLIAAVNGVAMGGGFEMALACDIILASDKAVFALPEPRVGLAALAGGLQRLPRMIPLKHAMGMILTGRRVSAEEGKSLGFVTEVVPHEKLMTVAREWAAQILECSPLSVRASKQVVMRSRSVADLEASMDNSAYPAVGTLFRSEDLKEGPRAFAEKRKPNWKGR